MSTAAMQMAASKILGLRKVVASFLCSLAIHRPPVNGH
jgi:hypothetical protein